MAIPQQGGRHLPIDALDRFVDAVAVDDYRRTSPTSEQCVSGSHVRRARWSGRCSTYVPIRDGCLGHRLESSCIDAKDLIRRPKHGPCHAWRNVVSRRNKIFGHGPMFVTITVQELGGMIPGSRSVGRAASHRLVMLRRGMACSLILEATTMICPARLTGRRQTTGAVKYCCILGQEELRVM